MNDKGITYHTDIIKEGDSRTIFYTREISGVTLVIIPKNQYKMFETQNTYVLEMIK